MLEVELVSLKETIEDIKLFCWIPPRKGTPILGHGWEIPG